MSKLYDPLGNEVCEGDVIEANNGDKFEFMYLHRGKLIVKQPGLGTREFFPSVFKRYTVKEI